MADVTWVISASLSMAPLWKELTCKVATIKTTFKDIMVRECVPPFGSLRLRIIAYRDLYMDSLALECSPFFNVFTHSKDIHSFVQSIRPCGGGIAKKSGMEALFCALHGNWRRDKDMRHIIYLITDSEAYLPEDPQHRVDQFYNETLSRFASDPCEVMPESMDSMRRLWRDGAGTFDNWNSSLVLFTANGEPWQDIAEWPRVSRFPLDPEAVRCLKMETIIEVLCPLLKCPGFA